MSHHRRPARSTPSCHAVESLERRALLSTAYAVTDLNGFFGNSLNDAGQIAGYVKTASGTTRPALWSRGKIIDLGTAYSNDGQATQVSAGGDVVGYESSFTSQFTDPPTLLEGGFVYHRGVLHTLGLLPGGDSSGALAINNNGLIVGEADGSDFLEHAVVFRNGKPQVLPGGATYAFAV